MNYDNYLKKQKYECVQNLALTNEETLPSLAWVLLICFA